MKKENATDNFGLNLRRLTFLFNFLIDFYYIILSYFFGFIWNYG